MTEVIYPQKGLCGTGEYSFMQSLNLSRISTGRAYHCEHTLENERGPRTFPKHWRFILPVSVTWNVLTHHHPRLKLLLQKVAFIQKHQPKCQLLYTIDGLEVVLQIKIHFARSLEPTIDFHKMKESFRRLTLGSSVRCSSKHDIGARNRIACMLSK